jgi:hypothetical protein
MGATVIFAEVNQELHEFQSNENSTDNKQWQGFDSRSADRDYDHIT